MTPLIAELVGSERKEKNMKGPALVQAKPSLGLFLSNFKPLGLILLHSLIFLVTNGLANFPNYTF